jgi:transposase-like protein
MRNNCALAIGPLRPKGKQVTAAEKAEWVRRFGESGLSLRKFSTQYGLRWASLWRWNSRYPVDGLGEAEAPEEVDFIEVQLPAPLSAKSGWAAELSFANGNVLRLNGELASVVLKELLAL